VSPELPGYVGFANLPNQVHRKSVKKGFEFTLMVVGESRQKAVEFSLSFIHSLHRRILPFLREYFTHK